MQTENIFYTFIVDGFQAAHNFNIKWRTGWNTYFIGAFVDVIVWQLDLQLSMQLVPIITDVASSNLDQGEVYSIMWSSLSVTCGKSVVFSGYFGFLHQ